MARRHAESVAQEPQGLGLQFNEPLSWRAGKPIATGELLKRLNALSNELREMDQEEIDKDSLTKVAKELAGQNILSHKDKGVRAFAACCLVDILKLCAPDAPFTGSQLKVCRKSQHRVYSTLLKLGAGHLHPFHKLHTPSPLGSFQCLQYPA